MVNVSENFKKLSMENGREISCKIVAGGEVFLDDKIIEFDFNDVIHKNWYTIGSVCSNRFAFSVRYSGELEVHDEVKPYISFDGNEWCPLGVFYVSRRYVRGNYASIICYDRMYSLDMEYVSGVTAPTTTSALLDDICKKHEISCPNGVISYDVTSIPSGATVREFLGFIAGVAFGNAKFDREGNLKIIPCSVSDGFELSGNNCMDYSRNMSAEKISRFVVDTGNGIIEAGSGGELSTVDVYNPLLTKERIYSILKNFEVMDFYGADIKMQGIPFIESGDNIYFTDEYDNRYPVTVSEIDYHYNGGLTARLYSKTRSYTDVTANEDELSVTIDKIRAALGNVYLKNVNSRDINLTSNEAQPVYFEFDTKISWIFAQVDMNFVLDGAGACEVTAYVNEQEVKRVNFQTSNEKNLIHFYFLAEKLPKGTNTVYITIRAVSGNLSIKSGALEATLVCRGATGLSEIVKDREFFYDRVNFVHYIPKPFKVNSFGESLETELTLSEQESD